MLPEKQQKAYNAFSDSAHHNEILDDKTTALILLSVSMALGCYPWMDHFLGVAKERKVTDKEIGAAQSLAMVVSAAKVRAQFREVRSKGASGKEKVKE
jgi:alkylhydroperoxidase/carboxymuconolactone decarboxylase family protein YurZ